MTDSRAARRKIMIEKMAEKSEPHEQEVVAAVATELFDFLDNIAAIRVSIERLASVYLATDAKVARR